MHDKPSDEASSDAHISGDADISLRRATLYKCYEQYAIM